MKKEIRDVLDNDSGNTSTVTGISLDMTTIPNGECISVGAFKRLKNLRFLSIYNTRFETDERVHVPEDMEFPPFLRLIHWEVYSRKCLPRTFCPEYLVKLNMPRNKLEKLWEGTQLLPNLKKMNLFGSMNLTELPDLSNATNLEDLALQCCSSLVEFPSSIGNLHKLKVLEMEFCIKLQVVPTHFNLASLETLRMWGCWQLRKFPEISTNITTLEIEETLLGSVKFSVSARLKSLCIYGYDSVECPQLREFDGNPITFRKDPSVTSIKKIPDWIKDLHGLKWFSIHGCSKLASLSLTELPGLLRVLVVEGCDSLETVFLDFDTPIQVLYFYHCFKLSEAAKRKVIANQSSETCITGENIPVEFVHRAMGNSLTIRSSFYRFRICVVLSPDQRTKIIHPKLWCRIHIKGCSIDRYKKMSFHTIRAKHLFMSFIDVLDQDGLLEQDNEVSFEFNTTPLNIHISECGVQILTDKLTQSDEAREATILEQNKCLIRDT